MRKGSLVVVGTGIESMGQLTPAARREIKGAQRVFHLVTDPLTSQAVRALNPRSESLQDLYAVGKHRLKTYAAMVERVLGQVRLGKRVCFALYGHPGVFAMPAHAAVRIARAEGHRATMLPAISADACLIADLGVDPGACGWVSYEATDFLLRHRRADPAAGLVLWQVGVVGRFDRAARPIDRTKLAILTEELLETYSAKHQGLLYEASTLPGYEASIAPVSLGQLHLADVSPITTLYVPPERQAKIDPRMLRRLGIKPADRINCLR
jgi:precorrin-6B methylase 1